MTLGRQKSKSVVFALDSRETRLLDWASWSGWVMDAKFWSCVEVQEEVGESLAARREFMASNEINERSAVVEVVDIPPALGPVKPNSLGVCRPRPALTKSTPNTS